MLRQSYFRNILARQLLAFNASKIAPSDSLSVVTQLLPLTTSMRKQWCCQWKLTFDYFQLNSSPALFSRTIRRMLM